MACKPLVFLDGIHGLAACIHRMRQGRSLEMQDRLQRLYGEDEPRLGVLVYVRDADRWAWTCLGWAWLDGAGTETLRAALEALQPDVGPFQGAA